MFLYEDVAGEASAAERAAFQLEQDRRVEALLETLASVTSEGIAYTVDLRLRPEGASGLLARSWVSFLEYSSEYMQPWERMAMVRARPINPTSEIMTRWKDMLSEVVYEYPWDEQAFESIRHLKRRIEKEKNKESRIYIDFKYGHGGIADLEFMIKLLQIRHGANNENVRTPDLAEAVRALWRAGAFGEDTLTRILDAHAFQRRVENRYQLMEEWNAREVSRESPLLARLARSLGYRKSTPADDRKAFLGDWEDHANPVRTLVEEYFYS